MLTMQTLVVKILNCTVLSEKESGNCYVYHLLASKLHLKRLLLQAQLCLFLLQLSYLLLLHPNSYHCLLLTHLHLLINFNQFHFHLKVNLQLMNILLALPNCQLKFKSYLNLVVPNLVHHFTLLLTKVAGLKFQRNYSLL